MLTGVAPFADHAAVQDSIPLVPSRLRPEISGDLDEIVMTAIDKDPANRFQNSAAFRDALRRRRYSAHPILSRLRCFLGSNRRSVYHALGLLSAFFILLLLIALIGKVRHGASIAILSSWALLFMISLLLSRMKASSWEKVYLSLLAPGADCKRTSFIGMLLMCGYGGTIAAGWCSSNSHDNFNWAWVIMLCLLATAVGLSLAKAPHHSSNDISCFRVILGIATGIIVASKTLGESEWIFEIVLITVAVFAGPTVGVTAALFGFGLQAWGASLAPVTALILASMIAFSSGFAGSPGIFSQWRIPLGAALLIIVHRIAIHPSFSPDQYPIYRIVTLNPDIFFIMVLFSMVLFFNFLLRRKRRRSQ